MSRFKLLAAVMAAVLSVCSTGPDSPGTAGGGDDFPNSLTTASIAQNIAGNLSGYQQWSDNINYQTALPGSLPQTGFETPGFDAGSLGKKRASEDSVIVVIDSSDTASGMLRINMQTVTGEFTRYDTIAVKWDDYAKDAITSNERIVYLHSTTETHSKNSIAIIRYDDLDGDGELNNPSAPFSRASAYFEIRTFPGPVLITRMNIDAGEDLDFETDSGNITLSMNYVKILSGDTVEFYELTDADGDSIILITGSPDSCQVNFEYRSNQGTILAPSKAVVKAGYVVFPKDSLKSYPVYIYSSEVSRLSTSVFRIYGHGPDSTFFPGDTAKGEIIRTESAGSCIAVDTLILTVKLGPAPNDSVDDSLCALYARSIKCNGTERDVIFSFVSDLPVANGSAPVAGSLSYYMKNDFDEWLKAEGTFDSEGITIDYSDSRDNAFEAIIDREGKVISYLNK